MDKPTDKKLHFWAGFGIAAVTSLFFGYIVGFIVAAIAGAAKELYDKVTGKGTPEAEDFAETMKGALLAIAISAAVSFVWPYVAEA